MVWPYIQRLTIGPTNFVKKNRITLSQQSSGNIVKVQNFLSFGAIIPYPSPITIKFGLQKLPPPGVTAIPAGYASHILLIINRRQCAWLKLLLQFSSLKSTHPHHIHVSLMMLIRVHWLQKVDSSLEPNCLHSAAAYTSLYIQSQNSENRDCSFIAENQQNQTGNKKILIYILCFAHPADN